MRERFLVVVAAVCAVHCGGESPTRPTLVSSALTFAQHQSPHFTFHYTPIDAATVANVAELVEQQHARILGDLRVPSMPQVSVFLYPDRHAMQEAVRPFVGSLPVQANGLVTGVDRIHVLSPSLAAVWSPGEAAIAIVHEFAHCVSLALNPTFGNNPRWLWETVAVFEAGQFVEPRTVPALTAGQPPSLARLSGFDNTDVYSVGYVLGEFIVSRWGRDGLIALIRANGSTQPVIGVADTDLVSQWYAWLRERYGL